MANNAPTVQIYSDLEPADDGDPSPSSPPEYWDVLLESRHDQIDPSYWLSLGHGDLYAGAMEDLQFVLESFTQSLYLNRMKPHNSAFIVRLSPMEDEEGNALPLFLHYDARLLSRWKMLFYAMAGSKYWATFEVNSIEVPKVLMNGLADVLKTRASFCRAEEWVSLSFRNNRLDMESALDLSRLVNRGDPLSDLCVNDNDLSSPRVADQLSKAIANHSNLRTVDLSGSGIGRNARSISAIASCLSLDTLILNNVSLESSGAAVVSEFLASNPLLPELELGHNQLLDNAAVSLAAALRTNSNLESLSLGDNNFSEAAARHFRGVIFDDSSLNAVLGCNHTCNVKGVPGLPSTLQCTKQKKKFRMICQRADDSNGAFNHRLFTDSPFELMPMVLAWIQTVPEDVSTPLAVLFEILRSWELPLLFLGRHQPEEVKACLRDIISSVAKDESDCGGISYHQAVLPPLKLCQYDVVLSKTLSNEFMINVGEMGKPATTKAVYGTHPTMLIDFRRHPDGSKGPAERLTPLTTLSAGDAIVAVNGIGTEGKQFREVIGLLKASLSFAHIRFQSKRSILEPVLNYAEARYADAFRASVALNEKNAAVKAAYAKMVESGQDPISPFKEQWLQRRVQFKSEGKTVLNTDLFARLACYGALEEMKDRVEIRASALVAYPANANDICRNEEVAAVLNTLVDSVERRELVFKWEGSLSVFLSLQKSEQVRARAWAQLNEVKAAMRKAKDNRTDSRPR